MTGAGELGIRMMNQMIDVKRRILPDVPDKFWQDFMAEVDPDDLNRLVVPVYARHFTVAEMESMIAFYQDASWSKAGEQVTCAHRGVDDGRSSMGHGTRWTNSAKVERKWSGTRGIGAHT